MVSAENVAWLNATGRRYVLGTARSELKRWSRQIADKTDWRQIREDVEVNLCRGPDGAETFLLCRSASRIDKERAMHARFCQRIEAGLARIAAKRCCYNAWGSRCRSDCERPRQPKCSGDFGPQPVDLPRFTPSKCGSWVKLSC